MRAEVKAGDPRLLGDGSLLAIDGLARDEPYVVSAS